jgi:Flp pilus assembly protein TadB
MAGSSFVLTCALEALQRHAEAGQAWRHRHPGLVVDVDPPALSTKGHSSTTRGPAGGGSSIPSVETTKNDAGRSTTMTRNQATAAGTGLIAGVVASIITGQWWLVAVGLILGAAIARWKGGRP